MPVSIWVRADLVTAAKRASAQAYAPYSKFKVGAAVFTKENRIFSGCNVENASYGLTCCAERAAVFQAVLNGATGIFAVLVYTPTQKATSPCGACRQVLNEFGPDADVISVCDSDHEIHSTVGELLPQAFGPHNLL